MYIINLIIVISNLIHLFPDMHLNFQFPLLCLNLLTIVTIVLLKSIMWIVYLYVIGII